MKYLKSFNESIFGDVSKFIKDKFKTKYDFIDGEYTVNPDGSIDVDGDVNFNILDSKNKNIVPPQSVNGKLPVKFNNVSGSFKCRAFKLKTLDGMPKYIGDTCDISFNELTSLKGSPKTVGGSFYCNNNKLTSLEGCPDIEKDFICFCNNLYDFYGIGKVSRTIYCVKDYGNKKNIDNPVSELILALKKLLKTGRLLDLENMEFDLDVNMFKITKEFINYLNEFRPIRGKSILGKRLEECFYMISNNENIDINELSLKNYEVLE